MYQVSININEDGKGSFALGCECKTVGEIKIQDFRAKILEYEENLETEVILEMENLETEANFLQVIAKMSFLE